MMNHIYVLVNLTQHWDYVAFLVLFLVHTSSDISSETGLCELGCRGPEIEDSSQLSSKTFLLEGDSYYRHVLELLFGRLTKSLYQQVWF